MNSPLFSVQRLDHVELYVRDIEASIRWYAFPVGGGIVADSRPEQEYEETLHKAAGLLRALG